MRASAIHPRTLEMFAEWGVIDEVLAQGYQVDRLQYWQRSPRSFIAEFDYARIAADTPYPFRLQCPQHILTRVLKPIVQRRRWAKCTCRTALSICAKMMLASSLASKRRMGLPRRSGVTSAGRMEGAAPCASIWGSASRV